MAHEDLAQIAALLGAGGVALVLLLPRRLAFIGGVALLAAAEALLAVALAESTLRRLLEEPAGIALLAVATVGTVGAAFAFTRAPAVVPVALLAAAPFRIPVEVADEKAFLLLPLYAVLGAATLAALVSAWRTPRLPPIPVFLALPVTAFVALTSISLLWTHDLRAGSIALAFFYLPFALGLALVARSPLAAWSPRALAVTLVGLGTAFAVIGLWQAHTRTLFFAPDLEVANAYTTFFRVTSVFKDPSLYGRYLVAAIAVLLVGLWLGRARPAVVLPLAVVLFAGLHFSYSQSSFVALFAVVLAIALVLGGPRLRTTLAAGVAIAVVAAGTVTAASIADEGARTATSGRSRLVTVTLDTFRAHPVVGVGIGGQPRASVAESGDRHRQAQCLAHDTAHRRRRARDRRSRRLRLASRGGCAWAAPRHHAGPGARSGALRRRSDAPRALPLLRRVLRGSADLGRSGRQRRGARQLASRRRLKASASRPRSCGQCPCLP